MVDDRIEQARDIIEKTTVPKQERTQKAGDLLEQILLERYPDTFRVLAIDLFLERGNEVITFGGELRDDLPDTFVQFPNIEKILVQQPVDEIEEGFETLDDLVAMFDATDEQFQQVTQALDNLSNVTEFRLKRQGVTPFLMELEEISAIASRSPKLWAEGIELFIKDTDLVLWAIQRVKQCRDGNDKICRIIEDEIVGENSRAFPNWYLDRVYERHLNDQWNPDRIWKQLHDVVRVNETVEDAQQRLKNEGRDPDLVRAAIGKTPPDSAIEDDIDDTVETNPDPDQIGDLSPGDDVDDQADGQQPLTGFDKATDEDQDVPEAELESEEVIFNNTVSDAEVRQAVIDKVAAEDQGEGAPADIVLQDVPGEIEVSDDRVEQAVNELLSDGTMFEPKPGRFKLLNPEEASGDAGSGGNEPFNEAVDAIEKQEDAIEQAQDLNDKIRRKLLDM